MLDKFEEPSRRVYLTGEITDEVAEQVIERLLDLDQSALAPIYLFINSPGGYITPGLAIYDIMNTLNSSVHTIGVGECCSIATIILSGGASRMATKHTNIMIHQPSGGIDGTYKEIKEYAIQTEAKMRLYASMLSKNTGQKVKRILKDLESDYWMTAAEAKVYGIIDGVYK